MRALLILLVLCGAACECGAARAERLEIGLSDERIGITSSFSGTRMTVFGTIEDPEDLVLERGGYDVVVALAGPSDEMVVRRKARLAGIWVNGASQLFAGVPASYALSATRPLDEIAAPRDLALLQIGADNLLFAPRGTVAEDREDFARSLKRLMRRRGLYSEAPSAVFLSPTLFRATLPVPANVPIGRHVAQAFLFRDGRYIGSSSAELTVQKTGFEQVTYDFAHEHGLLYGLAAVLVAVLTGWLASVAFRRD